MKCPTCRVPMLIMNDGAYCQNEDCSSDGYLNTDEMAARINLLENIAAQSNLRGSEEVYLLTQKMDEIRDRLIRKYGWTADRWQRLLEVLK